VVVARDRTEVGARGDTCDDKENRLVKVVQVSSYTEENRYSRDGLRRVRLAGDSAITYLWDDHVLLRDNSIFTTLPGAPGGLLASKGGTTHRFYIPDMQGHVRQVTDIDGDAIAEYQYDAWGLIQLTAASAMAFGDWGYTWDGKPGRYYVQQRHLRADLGRWMSVDPVETEPPYAYVANRPTWAVDPSGEQGFGDVRKAEGRDQALARGAADKDARIRLEPDRTWTDDSEGNAAPIDPEPREAWAKWMSVRGVAQGVRRAGRRGVYPLGFLPMWTRQPSDVKRGLAVALLGPFGADLRESARRNHVPEWLLAPAVLAEVPGR